MKKRKIKKMLLTIAFFVAGVFVLTSIWFAIENTALAKNNSFNEFLLFILGYGDVEGYTWLKAMFSILGILAIALLSSAFTVNLLDWKSKLVLSDKIIVWSGDFGNRYGTVYVKNKGNDIYNFSVVFQSSNGSNIKFREYKVPVLEKNKEKRIDLDISVGSVLYEYLRNSINNSATDKFFIMITYTDSANSQQYIVCKRYSYGIETIPKGEGKIVMNNALNSENYSVGFAQFKRLTQTKNTQYEDEQKLFYTKKSFEINSKQFNPINAQYIKIYNQSLATDTNEQAVQCSNSKNNLSAEIDFSSMRICNGDDFAMLCAREPLGGNWTKYYDLNCRIYFRIRIIGAIGVTLEIKNEKGDCIIFPKPFFDKQGEYEVFAYKLNNLNREVWQHVLEFDFTIFRKHVQAAGGKFEIIDCGLQICDN